MTRSRQSRFSSIRQLDGDTLERPCRWTGIPEIDRVSPNLANAEVAGAAELCGTSSHSDRTESRGAGQDLTAGQ